MARFRGYAAVVGALCCSGCALMYDAEREARTNAVAAAFDKTDNKDYFTGLRTAYAELARREEDTLQNSFQAQRDLAVISAVAPQEPPLRVAAASSPAPVRGTAKLTSDIRNRLADLVGCREPNCSDVRDADLAQWQALPTTRATARYAMQSADQILAARIGEARAAGAELGPDQTSLPQMRCADPVPPGNDRLAQSRARAAIAHACFAATDTALLARNGAIAGLLQQAAARDAAQRDAKAEAEQVRARIKALQKQSNAIDAPTFLKEAEEVRAALEKANIAPLAKKLGLETLGTMLEDLLKVELTAATDGTAKKATKAPSETTLRAQAALELIGATEAVVIAYRDMDPADRASALLIAIVAQRQALDMATLESDLASDQATLLRAQAEAEIIELSELARAEQALRAIPSGSLAGISGLPPRDRARARDAAIHFGLAWNEGRIPAEQLDQHSLERSRQYRVDVGERTAANRKQLIAPAIAQIQAAGKTGIKPELVAVILGQLGAGALFGE